MKAIKDGVPIFYWKVNIRLRSIYDKKAARESVFYMLNGCELLEIMTITMKAAVSSWKTVDLSQDANDIIAI